ncbi:transcriptional regulator [Bacillus sp. AFS002410]|uniref:LCP family protein n=1 Tax=Bacillus sp. AFS002410 TaxID=2033481 RepID=UPI000BF14860|nr:LCP family protein [Bacillus sp. AFS002410]PEJ48472.1 transcriptional regulator [Bacillus sp. AFS002410]
MLKLFRICLLSILVFCLVGCQIKPSNEGRNEANHKNRQEMSFKNKLLKNSLFFLVIGVDSRGEKNSRSDSIAVVQYNVEDRTLKVASILRDSYVKIKGYKYGYGKINQAYYLGGEKLLKDTIYRNLGIPIDHTVIIDFKGFVGIVDTLVPEGITVDVSQSLIDDMKLKMKLGKNNLHGEQLLKYVRFRHDQNNDFGRVQRQQEVLLKVVSAVKEKLNTFGGIARVPLLLDETTKYVSTDLKLDDILSLASIAFTQPIEKIDRLSIPVDTGYTNETVEHSGAVLKLDLTKNRQSIKQFFKAPSPVIKSKNSNGQKKLKNK